MSSNKTGRAPKVKDRWYNDHKNRNRRELKPRELKGTPQFTFDELYITPFTLRRRYSEDGRVSYVPVERNLQPTGFRVMDDFLRSMSAGRTDINTFCERYGARISDIDSLIFLLTGMRGIDFRQAYQLRMADELLRYTSLGVVDIARRCGFGSRTNLNFAYQRDLRITPSDRREKLRQQRDEERYKVE